MPLIIHLKNNARARLVDLRFSASLFSFVLRSKLCKLTLKPN